MRSTAGGVEGSPELSASVEAWAAAAATEALRTSSSIGESSGSETSPSGAADSEGEPAGTSWLAGGFAGGTTTTSDSSPPSASTGGSLEPENEGSGGSLTQAGLDSSPAETSSTEAS